MNADSLLMLQGYCKRKRDKKFDEEQNQSLGAGKEGQMCFLLCSWSPLTVSCVVPGAQLAVGSVICQELILLKKEEPNYPKSIHEKVYFSKGVRGPSFCSRISFGVLPHLMGQNLNFAAQMIFSRI